MVITFHYLKKLL